MKDTAPPPYVVAATIEDYYNKLAFDLSDTGTAVGEVSNPSQCRDDSPAGLPGQSVTDSEQAKQVHV